MVDSLGGVTAALRLFPEDATAFTTLGVGVLSDAISAKVTEERNGAYELTVEYPVDGAHFADVSLGSIIACKPSPYATHAQPFRVYSITTPMSGKVTIDAQHISYDLNAYTVKPFKASEVGAAMGGLKSSIVGECPFSFETDKATKAAFALEVPQSVRATLGGVDGSILDTYTGEYEWDGLTVRLLAHRGEDRGVTVEYGKNLTDLKQEQNNAAVYTHVYPFWHSDEAGTVTLDSPVSTGITGRERTLTLDLSSDDSLRTEGDAAPTQAQLLAACNAYIKAHELTRPKVSITVDFIELAKSEQYAGTAPLERVWLCDTVTVRFPKLGVDATAEVIKGTYDVLLDRWDKVELGDAKSTLSSTIAGMPAAIAKEAERYLSVTKTAVEAATRALTGITGGHVVIWNSATHLPDAPDEILIMDTDSIETAVNVWRYNAAGWGHSSTGYAGPYTMAAYVGDSSHAGGIVADAITSGILKAGRIEDSTGQNYWDLESGKLVMKDGDIVTNRIIDATNNANIATMGTGTFSDSDSHGSNELPGIMFGHGEANTSEQWWSVVKANTLQPRKVNGVSQWVETSHGLNMYTYGNRFITVRAPNENFDDGYLTIKAPGCSSGVRLIKYEEGRYGAELYADGSNYVDIGLGGGGGISLMTANGSISITTTAGSIYLRGAALYFNDKKIA